MSIVKQVERLTHCVEDFADYIDSLPEDIFLRKIDDWSPRDILAHLVGWNRLSIEGGRQMAQGETPSYFFDPGDDFSNANARLVKRYDSQDKRKLLDELDVSAGELKQYLLSLDPAVWDSDHGVTFQGEAVTIRNTVDALLDDYSHHKDQIRQWLQKC